MLSDLRSNRPEVFSEKGVIKNFTKFTGKHLCQSQVESLTLMQVNLRYINPNEHQAEVRVNLVPQYKDQFNVIILFTLYRETLVQ